MNPGEHRDQGPQGSGKGFRHGELPLGGLATSRQRWGESISQSWLSSEFAVRG
jgi:hypothetical protein